jgi:RNA polymerase sigma-70 factor (ECF subfamily)
MTRGVAQPVRFGTVVDPEKRKERLRMTGTVKLDPTAVELDLERHRTELTAYCYRMLGSAFEAEDAVQETLVRAWRSFDRFEGRSSVRSWLYRIASNVCFDMLKGRRRRALPMDMMPLARADGPVAPPLPDSTWVGPVPDRRVMPAAAGDPAEEAETRESVRLAFVAALQHLPPRQRAVLILREVLKWKASEVAELLDTTVVSVNSALQRARSTLADHDVSMSSAAQPIDDSQEALLARYVDAFERFDIDALVKLLHEDATMSMPPYPLWLRGADELGTWLRGPGSACEGSRLVAIAANGAPAFAQWRPTPDGGYDAWSIHVIRVLGGRITGIDFFVDPNLFPLFGQPVRIDP